MIADTLARHPPANLDAALVLLGTRDASHGRSTARVDAAAKAAALKRARLLVINSVIVVSLTRIGDSIQLVVHSELLRKFKSE